MVLKMAKVLVLILQALLAEYQRTTVIALRSPGGFYRMFVQEPVYIFDYSLPGMTVSALAEAPVDPFLVREYVEEVVSSYASVQDIRGLDFATHIASSSPSLAIGYTEPEPQLRATSVRQLPSRDEANSSRQQQLMQPKVREANRSEDITYVEPHRRPCCVFCKSNGEHFSVYSKHVLKNEKNKTVCPVLRKYICPNCKKTGDEAHTLKYCPGLKPSTDGASQDGAACVNIINHSRRHTAVRNSTGRRKILRY